MRPDIVAAVAVLVVCVITIAAIRSTNQDSEEVSLLYMYKELTECQEQLRALK